MDNLNKEQKEAVVYTEGRIRVTAGAGSGKTMTLACRYAYLVNEVGIDASSILCLTFTNKAANEMKSRVSRIVGKEIPHNWICTIHGFCVRFLREEIHRLGYPQNFIIIDTEDSKAIAKRVMHEKGLTSNDLTVQQIIEGVRMSKHIGASLYVREYILPTEKGFKREDDIVGRFIQIQKQSFALDFDDLIIFTLFLLTTNKIVEKHWCEIFDYIMVDEAQDCSSSEWDIIERLSKSSNNLFIVGDPDQCIYEWRGAKPDLFVKFKTDKDIILNENYRSVSKILDIANSIIAYNKNRIPKDLIATKGIGTKPIHYHAVSRKDEAEWIAETIKSNVGKIFNFEDFAVLYRSSFMSRLIETSLINKKIPYTVWGGVRFFERREIKDCLAYLRLVANKDDDTSFLRCVNTPHRKFGRVKTEKLMTMREQGKDSLFATLNKNKDAKLFSNEETQDFIKIIEQASTFAKTHSISETLRCLLADSGLEEMYRSEGDQERLDSIAELINSIKEYEKTIDENGENIDLGIYLQEMTLLTNMDTKDATSKVRLMTIHQSKGLEFPWVFITGLNDGIFPDERNTSSEKVEEERRLMYVGCTRAKNILCLTEAEGYNYKNHKDLRPSRFLLEFPYNYVKSKGRYIGRTRKEYFAQMKVFLHPIEECRNVSDTYSEGMKVRHNLFGEGVVVSVDRYRVEVQFSVGKRKVQPQYLKATEVSNNKLQS